MKYTGMCGKVNVGSGGLLVDVGSLCACFAGLSARRSNRGVRYDVATILVLVVLGKIAGEDCLCGVAEWVRHREKVLAKALRWSKARVPHRTTFSRILGHAVNLEEFELGVSAFFNSSAQQGRPLVVNLDGKTLRGTIPAGESEGLRLLAAFLPEEGWVLMQVEVGQGENEISAAPRLLQAMDLRNKVVTGDAMLAQRALSIQIVEGGGEYIWPVKENQPQLRRDIETLFEPEHCVKGFSPGVTDFRTAETREKGHGRMERRAITVSGELKGYLDWPCAEQVYKLERDTVRVKDCKATHQVLYGITSLTAEEAGPERLLQLTRAHWLIENGLHYRRDETLREDWCHLRTGHAAHAMATINNLVLGLLLRRGVTNVPAARRYYAAHLNEALRLILRC